VSLVIHEMLLPIRPRTWVLRNRKSRELEEPSCRLTRRKRKGLSALAISLLQKLLDGFLHRYGGVLGAISLSRGSFVIHKELSKIPHHIGRSVFKWKAFLQERKHFTSICSVNIGLFKKDNLIGGRSKFGGSRLDILGGPGLLATELVAGKGQDFETFVPELIGEFPQLCVLSLGQTSFRRNVYDDQDIALELFHVHHFPVNEAVGQGVKVARERFSVGSESHTTVCGLN
jgi:hypothetical protein